MLPFPGKEKVLNRDKKKREGSGGRRGGGKGKLSKNQSSITALVSKKYEENYDQKNYCILPILEMPFSLA